MSLSVGWLGSSDLFLYIFYARPSLLGQHRIQRLSLLANHEMKLYLDTGFYVAQVMTA